MYKYIVYKTTNKINNYIYIGVHRTDIDIDDGYIGNGVNIYRPATYLNPKTPFQYAVRKYGIKVFHRSVIASFDSEKEAYDLEKARATSKILN